jgi:4a-hydroxytetrahydrobiopterin dehydratase
MAQILKKHELEKASNGLKSWKSSEEELLVTYTFKSFRDAITFVSRISFEADEMDHHPEITNLYNKVSIRLTTHDAGNKVTEKDIRLAERIQTTAGMFLES